jgi:hypothetical protein
MLYILIWNPQYSITYYSFMLTAVKRRQCKPDGLYTGHIDSMRIGVYTGIPPGSQTRQERKPDEGIQAGIPAGL